MKRLSVYIFLILTSTLLSAQDNELEKIKAQLIEKNGELTCVNCDFIQTKESPMFDGKMISSGKLSYKKPDYLKWSYEKPFQYSFTIDGDDISIVRDGKTSALDANHGRIAREMAGMIKASIEGDYLRDTPLFASSMKISDGYVCVILLPKNKELKKMWSKMVLKYDLKDLCAKRFEIHENSGDMTTITFKNCRYEFSR